ncbi:MAG TPA: hypothetical protein VMX77_01630 [Candidatus Bathyarchaeia archaeon]|nr:hypothetical protein [Candidatus Bathyarchaeia archaeon]
MRKSRKNFLPTLLLAVLFWLLWGGLVYFRGPENNLLLIVFFCLLFLASFLTSALILASSRQGFIIALGIICFLTLRFFQLGNILNLILMVGILISLNLYLAKR